MTDENETASETSIDSFLGTKIGGGRGAGFLSWRDDGKMLLWLHPAAPIVSRWAHQFYKVEVFEDKDDKGKAKRTEKIQFFRFNCLEKTVVLERQRFRDKQGQREMPPVVCPYCKLTEHVHQGIEDGSINWMDPLFKFESEEDEFVIYTGGIAGMFRSKDLSGDDKKVLKKANIRIDEAYKQDGYASQGFIFCVIPHDEPDQCLIARETQALGKKMQKVINDQIDSEGAIKGNPCLTPYAFEWRYFEDEQFSDKYDVVAKRSVEPTAEVLAAFEEPPPNLTEIIALGDPATLRGLMEKYVNPELSIDFDLIFGAVEARQGKDRAAEDQDDEAPARPAAKAPAPKAAPAESKAAPAAKAAGAEEQVFGCDICDGDMRASDEACSTCGTVYKTVKGITGPFSRPCGSCKAQVEVTGNPSFKCQGCGATHTGCGRAADGVKDEWTAVAGRAPRQSRSAASAAAEPAKRGFSKPSRQQQRESSEAPEGES